MIETKSSTYILPGNPEIDLPMKRFGNLLYDERGELVQAKLNERFRGYKHIEDTHQYEQGEPISFSNTPRAFTRAQILREENDGEIQLLDPLQLVQYWNKLPEKAGTYADSSAGTAFPNEGPNETLRKRVLAILGKDKTEIPLLVVGLDVEPDQDSGFTVKETPYLREIEAPFLEKDQKVKYDPQKKTLVPTTDDDESGVWVYVPHDQSGFRRAYRSRYVDLDFRCDDLLVSFSSGRVPVFQDPKGRAEDLGKLVREWQTERDEQIAKANARYEEALRVGKNILRTGKP